MTRFAMTSHRRFWREQALCITVLIACLAPVTRGEEDVLACNGLSVRVGMDIHSFPYVDPVTDSGLELVRVQRAFEAVGMTPLFSYAPNQRNILALMNGRLDAASVNVSWIADDLHASPDWYLSDTVITYQNRAIALLSVLPDVTDLADISGLRILGFHNARYVLGPEFARFVATEAGYQEVADQVEQVPLLLNGFVDVVISDERIFEHWLQRYLDRHTRMAAAPELGYWPVVGGGKRAIAFTDPVLRNCLNAGLSRMSLQAPVQNTYAPGTH